MGDTSSDYRKRAQDAEAALMRVTVLLDAIEALPRSITFGGAPLPASVHTEDVRRAIDPTGGA